MNSIDQSKAETVKTQQNVKSPLETTIATLSRALIGPDGVVSAKVNSSGAIESAVGIVSTAPTGSGIGYATGAGGAVTQATSRTTPVTLSKLCGAITTNNASLAAGAEATFTVTNTTVAATDTVVVSLKTPSSTGLSLPFVSTTAAGSFDITLTNLHASTADTSASVINFAVHKAVAA